MTITKKDLIDAARAIGINAHQDQKHPNNPPLFLGKFGEFNRWNPEHNKSQLMDLQWGLKMDVIWDDERKKGRVSYFIDKNQLLRGRDFDNKRESFATAIILAAAEIGRAKQ